jgi:alpha-ketoglutarate-dependent taurine dioxygenase
MIDIKNDINVQDIFDNIEDYINLFLDQGILIFKGLNPTKEEEMKLMCAFEKHTGWFTNQAWHDEDHAGTFDRHGDRFLSKEELFIPWHIEHVEKENYQIGALWHMLKYDCDSDCGQTGFVNMIDIFSNMPSDWRKFLLGCKVSTLAKSDSTGAMHKVSFSKNLRQRDIVIPHYLTGKLIYRPNFTPEEVLRTVNDKAPINKDISLYNDIVDWTKEQVCNNPSNQFWFKWEVGDTIIVDLSVTAHAVKGGFRLGERNFSRIWAYKNSFINPVDMV